MPTWDDYMRWLGDVATNPSAPKAAAPAVAAWATDSRTIGKGQWFVPITGPSFDGHLYIEEAMRKGAEGFFYVASRCGELPPPLLSRGIAVKDALAAFQQVAAGWRLSLKDLKLVALTGSTGKTTTKEMLGGILKSAGPTFSTEGSFNNEVGVPKTLQQLTAAHRFAAVEFGARMPGNIRFLCHMGAPNVAGLLNVGVTHLGIFGSVENLLNTKLEIFRDSPTDALLVANADDPRILNAAKATGKKVVTFGESAGADIRVLGADWLPGGDMQVRLGLWTRETSIRLGVAHQAFPINAAAAAAMALAAGVTDNAVKDGLQGFRGIKGRYLVHRLRTMTVVDDTYNANPDSMTAGLQTLGKAFANERKILVLGDMLELGEDSAEDHRHAGKLASALLPVLLVAVGGDARHIADGAVAAGLSPGKIKTFANVDELLGANLAFRTLGDVLYAKASNGVKLGRLIDTLVKALS